MHILLFGRSGMVGSAIEELATQAGHVIEPYSRIHADFTDSDSCAAIVEKCDADFVINAAAYTAVDEAESNSDVAFQINALTPGALARVATAKGVPMVHISTDYVFSADHGKPSRPTDPTSPINVYGSSKRAGEKAILDAGGNHAILRTSWVFSAHGENFVKSMLRLSENRKELNIVSDQVGGPTAAFAIAKACISIGETLARDAQSGGIFHLSGSPDVSWADFAREIFRQVGRTVLIKDIATSEYPTPARRPLNSRLDCSSLTQKFDIERPDWRRDLSEVLGRLNQT